MASSIVEGPLVSLRTNLTIHSRFAKVEKEEKKAFYLFFFFIFIFIQCFGLMRNLHSLRINGH